MANQFLSSFAGAKKKKGASEEDQSIKVNIDGHEVTVVRTPDMTATDWNAIKARAAELNSNNGDLRTREVAAEARGAAPSDKTMAPAPDKVEIDVGDGTGRKMTIPRGNMSDEEWRLFVDKADIRERDKALKSKMKGEKEGSEPDTLEIQRAEAGVPDSEGKADRRSEAGGVRGMANKMMMGGIDDRPSSSGQAVDMQGQPQESGLRRAGRAVGEFATKAVQKMPMMNPAMALDQALGTGPDTSNPADMQRAEGAMRGQLNTMGNQLGTVAEGAGEFAGGFMGSPQAPAQAPVQGPEYRPDQLGPTPGAPPPAGRMPPGGAPPNGSQSMQAKMRTAPPIPDMPEDYADQINAAADAQKRAVEAGAEVESGRLQQESRLKWEQADLKMKDHVKREKFREEVDARGQELLNAYQGTLQELMKPSEAINPDRYWQSHSKILAAIGLALASNSKHGNGALGGMIQANINRDIEAQKADIEGNRDRLTRVAGMQMNLYGTYRQKGLDSYEAEKMAIATSNDYYKTRIESFAAASQSQTVKQNAIKQAGELEMEKVKALQAASQHRDAMTMSRARLAEDQYEFGVKESQKGKGTGGGRPLPAIEADKVSKLATAIQHVDELSSEFDKVSGSFGGALASKVSSSVPRTQATKFNNLRNSFKRTIELLVDESVVMKHDADEWDKILAEAGDLNGSEKYQQLARSVRMKLADKLNGYEGTGFDTRGLQQKFGRLLNSKQTQVPGEEAPR